MFLCKTRFRWEFPPASEKYFDHLRVVPMHLSYLGEFKITRGVKTAIYNVTLKPIKNLYRRGHQVQSNIRRPWINFQLLPSSFITQLAAVGRDTINFQRASCTVNKLHGAEDSRGSGECSSMLPNDS